MKLLGGAVAVTGLSAGRNTATAVQEGGPPNRADRVIALEDRFEDGSLDSDTWETGWGWGTRTRTSPTRMVPENVTVTDGQLRLEASHEGGKILSGSVNTKNKVTVEPGSYFEAKIKFPDRDGFLPAFWAKPNDETWPPEIDVVELFQKGGGRPDTHYSHHHLHYSTSTNPGDRSTYEGMGKSYTPGDDLTQNFHVYGVDWRRDRIVHYVDGEPAMVTTDPTVLDAMAKGAPFYLMCTLEVNKIGTAPTDEEWDEQFVVDWTRVWE
ncbi:glycoside hydrolase family 16 protein [Halorussus marinus]|uniref:glycoside hydrolase family 16 protein n=1 Tax=Halorussus marinus TaxID=2505976 RepID=UPI00142F6B6E|nr:glycoside hydrolase family 16 protein [Halorussus marinus]